MKKGFRVLVNAVLVLDLMVLIYFLYLILWPMKALDVYGQDKILNPNRTVVAGTPLIYEIDYHKYAKAQAAVTRALVGPVVYPLPASTNNIPVGRAKAISRNTIVPVGVQPGTYHLELSATYQVNFLRQITVRSRTEDFTVVAAAAGEPSDAPQSVEPAQATSDTENATGTSQTASPLPYGTDPVTGEPAHPTPSPSPGFVQRIIQGVQIIL